jgi:hypothetical protein
MIPGARFAVVLRGQTVGVCESQDEVSLVDGDGKTLAWHLADEEWDSILIAAISHGVEYESWHYAMSEGDPPEEKTP